MSDDQVQQVKDRVDIVDLVSQYVPLKRAGVNHKGLCPFHKEKSPSFMVNPERQIFKCFGCDKGGDVLTFVQEMEGLTFPEALELLADRAGITLDRKKAPEQYKQEKDEKSALYRINAASAKFFHKLLIDHPSGQAALDYLHGRGVRDETIRSFQLGSAPGSPVLGTWLQKHGFTAAQIQRAGSPERFKNRLMFPIRDTLGNVVAFTGRSLPGDDTGPKYYNTPESPIFKKSTVVYGLAEGKEEIRRRKVAVLVEGQMDVVLSHQAGVRIAVASSGTAITPDHLRTLKRYTPKVLLAFDADGAGIAATKKTLRLAVEADLAVKVVTMPEGIKDAGEAIAKDPALWAEAIKGARPGLEWLIDVSIATQPAPLDGAAKKLVAREVLPELIHIPDPVEQAHYVGVLAHRLGVKESVLAEAMKRAKQPRPAASSQPAPSPRPAPVSLERQLIGVLLLAPSLLVELAVDPGLLAKDSTAKELLETAQVCYRADERQTAATFLSNLKGQVPASIGTELDLLVASAQQLVGSEHPREVATPMLRRLQSQSREVLKGSIASQIAAAEAAGDRTTVKKLMGELQEMLKG